MSSLTKVSSTTRARHRLGYAGTRVASGGPQSKRAHTERSASSPWHGAVAGPSIYPAMSCAETLKSEEPGELKGAERK